eukprot:3524980-Prymnesium_polylepis.1
MQASLTGRWRSHADATRPDRLRAVHKALATAFEGDPGHRIVSRMVSSPSRSGAVKMTASRRMLQSKSRFHEYSSRRSSSRS